MMSRGASEENIANRIAAIAIAKTPARIRAETKRLPSLRRGGHVFARIRLIVVIGKKRGDGDLRFGVIVRTCKAPLVDNAVSGPPC